MKHLNSAITKLKSKVKEQVDEKFPKNLISSLSESGKRHEKLENKLYSLASRVHMLDRRMREMLQHRRVQNDLL